MSEVIHQMASGQFNAITIVLWTLLSFVLAVASGAAAGVKLAGKDLGNDLAALIGGMFGPVAAAPAVLVGLIVLAFS
jgi:hypothetical protein